VMRRETCWVDGAQGIAERGRGLGLVTGHQRAQEPVMHLGVEDREAQAIGGEGYTDCGAGHG
jgi:hypothetical protein